MIKILCDDTLEGTNRRRIVLFDDTTEDAIMTDEIMYESEEEAEEREDFEKFISGELDDDDD